MPHSTAPGPMRPEEVDEDDILLDAPQQVSDHTKEEGKTDMTDSASQSEDSTSEAPRIDVKVEDLFDDADDDEEDEFSGSRVLNPGNESSPPEAPL